MSTQSEQASTQPGTTPAFRISAELQAALRSLARDIYALEGEAVIQQGAHSKGVYLLMEGAARLIMIAEDGCEITRRELGPGALLGVPATLCSKPYLFSAVATEQSRFGFIDKDRLDDHLRANPGLCMEVVQMMSRELAEANQTRNLLKVCNESDCALAQTCSNQCQ